VPYVGWTPDGKWLISRSEDGTIRKWNAETGDPDWVILQVPGGRSITFSAAGEILHGDPDVVEQNLVYLVETDEARLEMLKPSEFRKYLAIGAAEQTAENREQPQTP
jgi:hypothetical protein